MGTDLAFGSSTCRWGKLLGFFGLLIALPMTCLLLAYYRRFLTHQSECAPEPLAKYVEEDHRQE